MRVVLLLSSLLPLLFAPADAFAWRQTKSCLYEEPPAPTATPYCREHDVPVDFFWPEMPVNFSLNERGAATVGVTEEALLEVVLASFETWNEPDCSSFQFDFAGMTDVEYAKDDVNVVVFHDTWPFASDALGITSVTATLDGELINADMELNADAHTFGIAEDDETVWDLQNTITHEAGHMLGLDHDAVEDSTMYAEARVGQTSKRTLHQDDIDGLCTIYPLPDEPDEPADGEGCCSTVNSPTSRDGVLLWVFTLLFAIVARARR